jgi:hypothetical protein
MFIKCSNTGFADRRRIAQGGRHVISSGDSVEQSDGMVSVVEIVPSARTVQTGVLNELGRFHKSR